MPKKGGWQALIEIKTDSELQTIPVAIWTTSDDMEDKIQCEIAGADVFVTKPVVYAELVNSVKTLVTRYSSQGTTADKISFPKELSPVLISDTILKNRRT